MLTSVAQHQTRPSRWRQRPLGPRIFPLAILLLIVLLGAGTAGAQLAPGVHVRFKLVEPADTAWHVRLGGHTHRPNWRLPAGTIPPGADRDKTLRIPPGQFSDWFDLKAHAGKSLHGRLNRAGGVAEFPNVTARFVTDSPAPRRHILIELAERPSARSVVKRMEESFTGELTSFLVSPTLRRDAEQLETASQMTRRRLAWARQATGGQRRSPERHLIQTSFWSPQRPELNVLEGEVLYLLGFNVVGNQIREVSQAYPELRTPGHTHQIKFGPASTRQEIDQMMKQQAENQKTPPASGIPYGFADEICARPRIGDNAQARAHFHAWLQQKKISARELGVDKLTQVVPLETPDAYKRAARANRSAAARIFYYTSRFRQEAGTERIRWHTESFHKYFPPGPLTSSLVADHPYFSGTGLGMGMVPNTAWGGAPLALDWFDLSRRKALDLFGIEDWMGLQYMYGPNYTWEGFQLMGFQAAMFRSGGRNQDVPIIAWITPSDETNLRLKSHSALCQGAKHFFYWTYGPTATSTENYWSDLRGAYDGVARVSQQLTSAEEVLFPARHRPTQVALLYSISSDLWQPYDYRHMLERRGTYLSLIHDQYQVDMLTEQDIEAGRLADYKVLYATDPNLTDHATQQIIDWVHGGGSLYAAGNAGTRNEFDEPVAGLAGALGVEPGARATLQPGNYRVRGRLNDIDHLDHIRLQAGADPLGPGFGVIGLRTDLRAADGKVVGQFTDGATAVVTHRLGKGQALCVASTPGISYIKDARFVPAALREKWPPAHRRFINAWARRAGAMPQVGLSHPVVEAGVLEGPHGIALVLANFTYQPIEQLTVRLPIRGQVTRVHAADAPQEAIPFQISPGSPRLRAAGFSGLVQFEIGLGLDQIVLVR